MKSLSSSSFVSLLLLSLAATMTRQQQPQQPQQQQQQQHYQFQQQGFTLKPPTTLLESLEVPATKEYEDDEKPSKLKEGRKIYYKKY